MKSAAKIFSPAFLVLVAFLLSACSGVPQTSTGGGGGTTGPFTISATVTGLLTGNSVVLADNTADQLTFNSNTTLPFAVTIANGGNYAVTVLTQPASGNCVVVSGSGKATGNVTIQVNCTFTPVTAMIGGNITGLVNNSTLVLQDNGGDSLTVTGTNVSPLSFTFKTPVTGPTDAYAVTVLTQPANPLQICTVTNGTGTATANVTSVAINCVLAYTIGGTVTGVVGTGLTLQNTGAEQLPITANGEFTFVNPVPTGFAYTVTIFAQPTNPAQTCVVTTGTGSGTATSNVTSIAITCPAITYSVGGNVVGLQGIPPTNGPETDGQFLIETNLGNSLIVSANGPFTFATPEALNDQYEISILHSPSTQSQGCTLWDYKGVVTGDITNIVVDCAHNDWTWIDGLNVAGTIATPKYGAFPTSPPQTIPNPYANTPGARYSAAGWTDLAGNLWLFGGEGWELTGNPAPDTLDAPMNDLWVCPMIGDQCQWQLVGGYNTTYGAAIIANAQTEAQFSVYTNVGALLPYPTPVPGGRLGTATWTDASGNLWMFGGKDPGAHFLNELWEYNTSGLNIVNLSNAQGLGQWVFVGGSESADQPGTYTGVNQVPGARVNPTSWKDSSGNFWLFGGYGFDGSGNLGYLNDLWEYTGGKWSFVSGSALADQNGVYGTAGAAAPTNVPGGRHEAVGWSDANGNLWLFGGEGEDSIGTANGILNDLWIYNIASKQWTYVMGATQGTQVGIANQTGVYGLQPLVGPPSTTGAAGTVGLTGATSGTFPGSRWGSNGWTDAGGNFWLFGGWGLDSTGTNGNGALNDLWVYTPNSTAGLPGTWTWIKGSNTGSDNGIYGPETRPYLTYEIWTPGGRSNATHWYVPQTGQNGLLFMFGGEGYDSTSTIGNGYLNDLWRYLPYLN